MIQIGQPLPDTTVRVVDDSIHEARTGPLLGHGKVLLFGVPGAFTPTCSEKHLPGYVAAFAAFQARGVRVACLAVNDAFVMRAWATQRHVPRELVLIADGNADFTCALGLELDRRAYGMGLRARRFALHAVDGVVKLLQVEAPGELKVSTAEAMLAAIDTLA